MPKPRPHIEERTTKVTVRIENDLYKRVKSKFYYGQLQTLFSKVFDSLDVMLGEDKIMEIVNFIQNKKDLRLRVPKNEE